MGRIYVFTGKGGVGKSSVASAHALMSAREGKKTLLVSTDAAHNLGDLFERKLGREEVEIMPNLTLYEIDPEYVMEHDFAFIMGYLTKLLSDSENLSIKDLGMVPGMEELFSLLKIAEIHQSQKFDRIIVDCAPTGETLSLLKFPELLSWYMEKLFPIGKIGVRVLAPISKTVFKVEMPNKNAMSDIEKMYVKLMELQELLKDRSVTSIRIVTMPEKMVVEETKRNYMYVNLYNFNVDGLYVNRILPADVGNAFFDQWITIQKEYLDSIKDCFQALPIYEIPWYDEEVRGVEAIQRIVDDVLAKREDGADVFESKVITQRESFLQNDLGYQLEVFVPCAEKGDVDLWQASTDVVIKIGNFKRNIPLPNVLRTYQITGAKLEEGKLRIQFERGSEQDE